VEDEFWSFEEMKVPNSDNAVRFIQGCRVLIVGGDAQLGILSSIMVQKISKKSRSLFTNLRRPIHVSDRPVFDIPFVSELTNLFHPLSFRVITVKAVSTRRES
jgi:hypothetical protein